MDGDAGFPPSRGRDRTQLTDQRKDDRQGTAVFEEADGGSRMVRIGKNRCFGHVADPLLAERVHADPHDLAAHVVFGLG